MINDIKKFLNEDQDPKAVEKISEKVNDLLTNGETVEYIGGIILPIFRTVFQQI